MKVRVYVTLKKAVLDPQGKAVQNSLLSLGYRQVKEVRVGKLIEVTMEGVTEEEARIIAEDMCRKLLANTVIEDFKLES